MIFLRHWKLLRWLSLVMAVSSASVDALVLQVSHLRWLFVTLQLLFCILVFGIAYFWPSIMRWMAEINHRHFHSMNPRATWPQTIVFWFGLIGILLHGIAFLVQLTESPIKFPTGFSISLCAALGFFVGSGDFLTKEQARKTRRVGMQSE